jgi:GNAT superfamily N-acetyltransferase
MDPATTLRDATRADVDALVEFNAALAWETEHRRLDPAVLRPGVAAVFDDARRGFYLVAERDGAVIGGLLVTFEWSDWRCGEWWWVQSVYVRPQARGQGVFGALYRAIEARARAAGAVGLRLYVERDNLRAQRTYATLGMDETHYRLYERPFIAGPADGR